MRGGLWFSARLARSPDAAMPGWTQSVDAVMPGLTRHPGPR